MGGEWMVELPDKKTAHRVWQLKNRK